MAVTWEDLRDYIDSQMDESQYTFVEQCFDRASARLADVTASAHREIPEVVYDGWILEVGHEFWTRKNSSPSGASQYANLTDGVGPVRGPRDPLAQIRTELASYVVML